MFYFVLSKSWIFGQRVVLGFLRLYLDHVDGFGKFLKVFSKYTFLPLLKKVPKHSCCRFLKSAVFR